MTEIELKLAIPPSAVAAVARAVGTAGARRQRLQAIYFDTADRRLAAAGIALRLRKEGRRWVQTLKVGPAHGMARGEHNVELRVPAGVPPALDPALHAVAPIGRALAAALEPRDGEVAPALLPLYRTDVTRLARPLRSRRGTVELALDRGEIVADGPDGRLRRWPACELEVELLGGSPVAVAEVARRFARAHGLWLDTRTKAERGDRLARGIAAGDQVPAVKAEAVRLRKDMAPVQAWATVLRQGLAQALPNWSEVAGGSGRAEHLHQLRVALRRLRSAERFFAGWPGVPEAPWSEAVAALFRALGATRDRDALAGGLQPAIDAALAAQGLPSMVWPMAHAPDWTGQALHDPGIVLVELLAYAAEMQQFVGAVNSDAALTDLAAERLDDWHARVRRDAKRFDTLDDEARHRLRKRVKRLRYAAEFSAALFPRRAVERYMAPLRAAQERLGEFNDVCVAQAACKSLTDGVPQAWFALGWLAARRDMTLAEGAAALQGLRKAEPFWR
ncbi:CYTH and CHAD domain-containing protein [uncultured Methylibium sp.]|uniref:CYTH and CHAD domain-containing protein n=1 Tax=uncultured Methylibium sp. TaxID=381093 RepID=UPI0025CB82A7|nr:CYTH and CHAD domain-containing protein [uncultured Methylibium sp.]